MATTSDYYQLLGVSRGATDEQIRSAYRKLARRYHPDVNNEANAAEQFKRITEAYEVLTDPQRRPAYGDRDRPPRRGAGARAGDHRAPARDLRTLPGLRRGARLRDLNLRHVRRSRRGAAGPAVGVRPVRECLDLPALRRRRQDRRQALHALPRRGSR